MIAVDLEVDKAADSVHLMQATDAVVQATDAVVPPANIAHDGTRYPSQHYADFRCCYRHCCWS